MCDTVVQLNEGLHMSLFTATVYESDREFQSKVF